jgi:hypothetical protein
VIPITDPPGCVAARTDPPCADRRRRRERRRSRLRREVRVRGVASSVEDVGDRGFSPGARAERRDGGGAVVLVDALVVLGGGRDPQRRDEEQHVHVGRRHDPFRDRVGDTAGDTRLRRSPRQPFVAFARDGGLVHEQGRRLHREVRAEHDHEGDVANTRGRERRRPCRLDGSAPATENGVHVRSVGALTDEAFAHLRHPCRTHPGDRTLGRVSPPAPEALVDLARYPVGELTGRDGRALVDRCRRQLAESGACELPGFLTPTAVTALAEEAQTLAAFAHRSRVEGTCYLDFPDETYPDGHPRRVVGPNALGAVAYDQFPPDSGLRALYEWGPLRKFAAAALQKPELFPYADPLGALNLAVMTDGDELAWHFDQTDFVVSLSLVPADCGGAFEYAPRLRGPDEERYDAVESVLAGDTTPVRHLPMIPGTLLLFEGRYSLHRVTPVEGEGARLVALLAYDTKPGTTSSELLRLVRYGRSA